MAKIVVRSVVRMKERNIFTITICSVSGFFPSNLLAVLFMKMF